jgi:hypothetical protein
MIVGVTNRLEDLHIRSAHFSKFPLTDFGIGIKKGAAIERPRGEDAPPGRRCSNSKALEGPEAL